jgi:predicted DNA-binding protein
MAGEPKKRTYNPKVETRLARVDINRLDEAARQAGKTRSDFIRQGLLWYLDNLENLKEADRENKTAQAIRYASDQIVKAILSATDRICGMLARQGAEVGTLYELTWRACGTPQAKEEFTAAANTAKQRQRNRLDADEKSIAERTKKVVTS